MLRAGIVDVLGIANITDIADIVNIADIVVEIGRRVQGVTRVSIGENRWKG